MKVVLDIPDWAIDGYLHLLWNNMETVAYKENGKDSPWMIKTSRCNQCGECCLEVQKNLADDEGACRYLVKENDRWPCHAGGERRIGCFGDPGKEDFPDCTLEYKEQ